MGKPSGRYQRIHPYSIRKTTIQYVGESGQIRKVTSPGGRVLRFRYDRNKIVEVADDTVKVLRYEYDKNGNITKIIQPEVYDATLDAGAGIQYTKEKTRYEFSIG